MAIYTHGVNAIPSPPVYQGTNPDLHGASIAPDDAEPPSDLTTSQRVRRQEPPGITLHSSDKQHTLKVDCALDHTISGHFLFGSGM